MSAQIISGKDIANEIRAELRARVEALASERGVTPGLATVLVGEDPASQMYVGMKNRVAGELGIHSRQITLSAETSEEELLGLVAGLNADPDVHGILVQLPLPNHISEGAVIEAIHPSKDVDGFHPMSVGRLATDSGEFFAPCTPAGIVEMLVRSGHDPSGKHAVIVGRSNIVGRPLASLLLRKGRGGDATVTVAHSRTPDLGSVTRSAEILVVAMGRPEVITGEMVSPGTVVIDVGTNRVDDPTSEKGYRVCGDVLFDEVRAVASAISPVPGGVGPMTITMLLSNTVKSAELLGSRARPGVTARVADELSLDLFPEGAGEGSAPAPAPAEHDPAAPASAEPPSTAPDPAAPAPKVWSVSQVNRAVRGLLEDTVDPLWVGGEIGGWSRSRAGHCYFTLKDDRAQIRCVMFDREAQQLPAGPEEGMQVRAFGDLTLYEARGEYQLVVRRLEAAGAEGLWRLAFEKLRARLDAEGLLAPERKRPLPAHPRCVGVVTSPTGAALRDIVAVLRRRAPWTRVVLSAARVQGEGASLELAGALRTLAASGLADVIIVGRGGGSVEDLWAFNEEALARAIAASPVPVVSAVGHEVDVTISDLVADARAPTPSAAAEAVAPDGYALRDGLSNVPERLARGLRAAVARRRGAVGERFERLSRVMEGRLAPLRQAVDRGLDRLEREARARTERGRHDLARLAGRLDALSPLSTLRRGYAVPRTADGHVLRAVADFPPGARFRLRVRDGTVTAETIGSEPEETPLPGATRPEDDRA